MTSANVVYFRIRDAGGKILKEHRENILCKSRFHELVQFVGDGVTVQSHGEDEYESPWEGDRMDLRDFLKRKRVIVDQ